MSTTRALLRSLSVFATAVLLGMAVYLLAASLFGWIQPVWWGGTALFTPIVFGLAFVVIATMPLYLISKAWIQRFAEFPSPRDMFIVGMLVGVGFLPSSDLLGVVLRPVPAWQSLNPWVAVASALLMAGVLMSLLASTLVGLLRRLKPMTR